MIVLYNEQPPSYIYQNQTCQIYLVDNTPERNLNISFDGITYIPLGANMGIAKALNVGIEKAINDGAQWVITMDQDSILPNNMLNEYEKYVDILPNVGILSPQLNMYDGENKKA